MPKSHFLMILTAVAVSVAAGLSGAALAQEVVQPLPDPAEADLARALARLEDNPRSVSALLAAGNASLHLGDSRAALSFFNRAQDERPDDPRVLTGLAQIAVQRGEAAIAIQLFDNADVQGGRTAPYAAQRGLAYDLVGNNARAQRYYRQALSREESDQVIRRLALSYAISGNGAASEATLLPLLQRQDRAAFRARAFALAIMGQDAEAQAIAETMLPQRLSQRLAPYLRHMPRLTPAQQAAAAHLGRFPQMADIGRDSPAIAALAQASDAAPAIASTRASNDRLTPAGTPLGPVAAQQLPSAQPMQHQPSGELPARAGNSPLPSFSVNQPVTSTPEQERVGEQRALAEAFADFRPPTGGIAVQPGAGAVDVTAITPARPAPLPEPEAESEVGPEAEPALPAHPARHWVQLATGRDISAFRFDWRRIVRNANGLLDGRDAFTAPFGRSHRLVTGPFESRQAANAFVARLGEAGVDSFRFTSSDGEEVAAMN